MGSERTKINVLDKGFVRLIDLMGSDLTVVNAARVSFAKESEWQHSDGQGELSEKDKKLISYLAKNSHWTPFAHPQICIHIKAPLPIRTQFFKHKIGFVENEISRRYVDEDPDFFYPRWSSRPEKSIKQGSGPPLSLDDANTCHFVYANAIEACRTAYSDLLRLGVAPEQARMVLPNGMMTEWYWTGSLAAYARFYKQRSDIHAQAEIQEYAKAIGLLIKDYFPHSWKALTND